MDQIQLKKDNKNKKLPIKEVTDAHLVWANDFLFEQYPDAILIADGQGKILDANSHLTRMVGYEKSEMIGKRIEMLMPRRYRAEHVGKHKERVEHGDGRAMKTGIKFLAERKDGTQFPIDIMLAPAETENGKVTVTVIRDITEIKKAEAREKSAKDALEAVIHAAPMAIIVIDLDKKILSWSREAETLFGYCAKEVLHQIHRLIPPGNDTEGHAEFNMLFDTVLKGKTSRDVHRKWLHKDGHLVDVSISAAPMHDLEGNVYAITYCAQDMSERLQSENKLNKIAYFDPYTLLPNREHLKKDLGALLSVIDGKVPRPCFVARIEVEDFVEITNTLGQAGADKLIIEIVNRFTEAVYGKIRFYRINQFEFGMMVPECGDPNVALELLEPLLEQLEIPFEIDGKIVHLRSNTGLAISPNHGNCAEDLLTNADLALFTAKNNPTTSYVFYDKTIKAQIKSKRELDLGLRQAFENNEFELFYQPQVRLSDGTLIGAEALLRWRHPTQGLIQPYAFIDTLANHPISYDVGNWILQTALKQAAKWRAIGLPDFRMGVNLFAAQFDRGSLVEDVNYALDQAGLPASALELEITENIAIGFDKKIIKPLKTLKDQGVGIAFDDFGTGFASLSYLVRYPLSRIKIDRSFLQNIPKSKEEGAVVHATIQMAHGLGLEVIAEGIETPEQEAFLQGEKCDEGQGYYYAKPLQADLFLSYAKATQFKSIAKSLEDLSAVGV